MTHRNCREFAMTRALTLQRLVAHLNFQKLTKQSTSARPAPFEARHCQKQVPLSILTRHPACVEIEIANN